MIKIENYEVVGWEHAIRGMRNPMNSWSKSDSERSVFRYNEEEFYSCPYDDCDGCHNWNENDGACERPDWENFRVGPNDYDLMTRLAKGGPVHAKYRRMITVYLDITAPLYWWKEFDTYKVGTVANSCSTMHKIHAKEFTLDDFSHEHLSIDERYLLEAIIEYLNQNRKEYIETDDKQHWWNLIQLLPTSYNQKRTVMLNYEVLTNIYHSRTGHKLQEWHVFCDWIKKLPYSELITGKFEK